jgi:hypothetical protein
MMAAGFEVLRGKYLSGSILFLLLAGLILINTGIGKGLSAMTKKMEVLKSVEIRNYEGKHLSSVNDFRENSIKGPQYVDKNTYRLTINGLV